MIQCPNCGSYLEDEVKFCGNCGYSLEGSDSFDKVNIPEIIRNTFNELNSLNFIGLECLKCGSKASLTLFKHIETISTSHRRYTSYKTKSINIPLCQNCNSNLSNWIHEHSGAKSRSSYSDVLWIVFCGLAFGIGMAFTFPIVSIIIFSLMALGIIYVIYRRRLKKQINSPYRYIKFRLNKTYVRPRGEGDWIKYDVWLNTITQTNQFAF